MPIILLTAKDAEVDKVVCFPDLVVSLSGKIEVDLAGFIDSTHGLVRSTFDVIPDAPLSKFTLSMRGGALVNHLDLCEIA